jgi:methylglyoxal/glyoxal reductase
LRDARVPREELFVTTKVWNTAMREDRQEEAFRDSLDKLGCGYVDLYLIHWPVPGKYAETWSKLEKIYKSGEIRAIGVSNFNRRHIETLMETAEIMPAVNQIELHPLLSQPELTAWCREKGIAITAWSPLGQGNLLTHPVIMDIAKNHNVGEAQVILRWHLEHGNIVIPKSIHRDRILRNADLYGFELSADEMSRIDALNRNSRFGADPETFEF